MPEETPSTSFVVSRQRSEKENVRLADATESEAKKHPHNNSRETLRDMNLLDS